MSQTDISPLLELLRAEMKELAARTRSLANACTFCRVRDRSGSIVTTLIPAGEQCDAARQHDERLRRWTAIVTSVLRRRGISTEDLQSMVDDLSRLVRLDRKDRAVVRERGWRKAFDDELTALQLQLDHLLTSSRHAFESVRGRGTSVHDSLHVRVTRKKSGQWCIDADANGDSATEIVDAPSDIEIQDFLTAHCGPDHATASDGSLSGLEAFTEVGSRLFRTVFHASVGDLYQQVRRTATRNNRGLRVEIDASSPAEVPWETLHDGSRFLALSDDVSVSRAVTGSKPAETGTRSSPFRILLTISSPIDLAAIDSDAERRTVEEAVASRRALGLLELDVATDGSLATLRRMLRTAEMNGRPYHAWHFAGHGRYDSKTRRSVIAMTADGGKAHWTGGPELMTLFTDTTEIQLILLKSCEGGAGNLAAERCSLIPSLLAIGLPLVVAMRFEISYDASTVFDEAFYGAIAEGFTADEAVAAARRAIVDRPNYAEWITPAVFRCGREVFRSDSHRF